jgi:arsenate reductase (thioredoxin)
VWEETILLSAMMVQSLIFRLKAFVLRVYMDRDNQRNHPLRVLVLCTGNSARSIMAEALFNVLGQGRIVALSAGSQPVGRVNPFAIEQIDALGVDTHSFYSKSWSIFEKEGAPTFDVVVTVCGQAAQETCPVWMGSPVLVHWGLMDPAQVAGSDIEKRQAFEKAFFRIKGFIEQFVVLPLEEMSLLSIKEAMQKIAD